MCVCVCVCVCVIVWSCGHVVVLLCGCVCTHARAGRDDAAVATMLLRSSVAAGVRLDWAAEYAAAAAFLVSGSGSASLLPRPGALMSAVTSACMFASEWLVRDALDNSWLAGVARARDRTLLGLGLAICLIHGALLRAAACVRRMTWASRRAGVVWGR